ncbi:MAG TPA: hypothetical protein VN608_00095 [Clostridia bacterium]|nr:hypothetical protein [Clostridia bacterium]
MKKYTKRMGANMLSIKGQTKRFLLCQKGDAGINWLLGVVLGVAIVAILIGIVSAAIPTLWSSVMSKITEVLG